MTKDIKDYLHLYLNAPCEMVALRKGWDSGQYIFSADLLHYTMRGDVAIKLHLRQLSDMTDGEAIDLYHKQWGSNELDQSVKIHAVKSICSVKGIYTESDVSIIDTIELVRQLLSKGFDLFNLIPDGLAIDATKIKKTHEPL